MDGKANLLSVQDIYDMLRGQVHPVVLTYDSDDVPFHGVGTAFIVEHRDALFLISAQHILDSQRASSSDIRIVWGEPPLSLSFDLQAIFNPDMEPHFDLVIMRIAAHQRQRMVDLGFFWIGTEFSLIPEGFPEAITFMVVGYPDERRGYDYEEKHVFAELAVLRGTHAESSVPGLGALIVAESTLESFRGLSGSLILAMLDGMWRFAGMVTMGSRESNVINFIPASYIAHYIDRFWTDSKEGRFAKQTELQSESNSSIE